MDVFNATVNGGPPGRMSEEEWNALMSSISPVPPPPQMPPTLPARATVNINDLTPRTKQRYMLYGVLEAVGSFCSASLLLFTCSFRFHFPSTAVHPRLPRLPRLPCLPRLSRLLRRNHRTPRLVP